jgi:hypothetical protein
MKALLAIAVLLALWGSWSPTTAVAKTVSLRSTTPQPLRFVVRNQALVDLTSPEPQLLLRGIGYSPYLPGETPLQGAAPGDDDRYDTHLAMIRELGTTYLHVFPRLMPATFFNALDRHDLVYGQDIWIWPYQEDLLAPDYQEKTLKDIREIIDHTYHVGRPDRLVLFSIGDELQAAAITSTDARHPQVRDFSGKHLVLTGRSPSEIAMARLVDEAMDYELNRYGQRHLYCHTSWTHVGPLADRPDLEVSRESVFVPDMGDLTCLNIYTYARGVRTSPPGSRTGSTFQGYLEQLAAETSQPILITQVGLSTSPIAPKPWVPGFGGHEVEDVPAMFRALWQDLRTARGKDAFCGLVFFEFLDEWWKSGEDAADPLSHEPADPEEWFGLYGVDRQGFLLPKGAIPETVRQLFTAP